MACSTPLTGITSPATTPLLTSARNLKIFDDSKTIVDRPLRGAPEAVAAAFANLQMPDPNAPSSKLALDRDQLKTFVEQWTNEEGSDLVPLEQQLPPPPPTWLLAVTDPAIRQWAHHIHHLWGTLCRQLSPGVSTHPERHTMLWVPNPVVIPGARFREVYYWDSYWVLKGLLVSRLFTVAQGVLDNLLHLVEQYGHVPNGIRTYYLNRSQPPLLSEMVRVVHEAAPCRPRLVRALRALLTEHAYWTSSEGPNSKQVAVQGADGQQCSLSRYCADWHSPRPESHREDAETAEQRGGDTEEQRQVWQDLASGAESGWDFSSRWLADGHSLASIQTTRVIPADLNAFLYQMETNIAAFAAELGQADVAQRFDQLADTRRTAINHLMWDPATHQWRDLVLCGTASPAPVRTSSVTAASNWVPLFAGLAEAGGPQAVQAVHSLLGSGLVHTGGLASTTIRTGQQWDFPNMWPPLVDMLVTGAAEYGGAVGAELASRLSSAFLCSAYAAWRKTGRMFEKFDVEAVGAPGGGGEYVVVDGFGWTNGVTLLLLEKFGWST